MITLLTDFDGSTYPAQMKGVIYSLMPQARVVDLSHQVPFADVRWAAYTLLCAHADFPVGTVHICVVDPGVGSRREVLILSAKGHTFVAPDNGLLWPVWERYSPDARVFHLREYSAFCRPQSQTFHGRDLFAPVAAWIALGVPLLTLGEPIESPGVELRLPQPQVEDGMVVGEVVLVDPFGNLITNIEARLLPGEIGRIVVGDTVVEGLVSSYSQWEGRGVGAVVDSCGLLELFVFCGSAKEALGVGVGERVEVYIN